MGFNNGYDAGYEDCEAQNRKRWEAEAFERGKAAGGGSTPAGGGSTPAGPALKLSELTGGELGNSITVYQVCAQEQTPLLDTTEFPVSTVGDGGAWSTPSGVTALKSIVVLQTAATEAPNGFDGDLEPGVYFLESTNAHLLGPLDAVVP